MSWKPTVNTAGDPVGVFTSNGMRFETEDEALRWARDLALRWTAVRDYRAEESTDPINYKIEDDRDRLTWKLVAL